MLPEGGVLKVTYISTKRTPKMSDIMSGAMFSAMTRLTKKFAADARRPVLEVQLVPGRLHDQQALREHYNVFGRVSLIELVKFIDGAGFTPAPHEDATHAFVHFRDPDTAENALEDGSSLPAAAGAEPVSLEVKWASEESVSEEKMVQLLRISAAEACFSCRQVSELVDMFLDSDWRVDVLSFLMPKTVDLPNWNSQVWSKPPIRDTGCCSRPLTGVPFFAPGPRTGFGLHGPRRVQDNRGQARAALLLHSAQPDRTLPAAAAQPDRADHHQQVGRDLDRGAQGPPAVGGPQPRLEDGQHKPEGRL